jgi:hypothetical protein
MHNRLEKIFDLNFTPSCIAESQINLFFKNSMYSIKMTVGVLAYPMAVNQNLKIGYFRSRIPPRIRIYVRKPRETAPLRCSYSYRQTYYMFISYHNRTTAALIWRKFFQCFPLEKSPYESLQPTHPIISVLRIRSFLFKSIVSGR